jgi:hypothetical protein
MMSEAATDRVARGGVCAPRERCIRETAPELQPPATPEVIVQ